MVERGKTPQQLNQDRLAKMRAAEAAKEAQRKAENRKRFEERKKQKALKGETDSRPDMTKIWIKGTQEAEKEASWGHGPARQTPHQRPDRSHYGDQQNR